MGTPTDDEPLSDVLADFVAWEFANRLHRDPERNARFARLWNVLREETDRGLVLALVAYLDDMLRALLEARFIERGDHHRDLFDNATAPLHSFSGKVRLASALGLISPGAVRDLHRVRSIRNSFAHEWDRTHLGDVVALDAGLAEQIRALEHDPLDEPSSPRRRVLRVALMLAGLIDGAAHDLPHAVVPPDLVIDRAAIKRSVAAHRAIADEELKRTGRNGLDA